jgi:hypothetical protein
LVSLQEIDFDGLCALVHSAGADWQQFVSEISAGSVESLDVAQLNKIVRFVRLCFLAFLG